MSELHGKSLEAIFTSNEYIKDVNLILNQLKTDAKLAPNEKTIESRFDFYFRDIFKKYFSHLGYKYEPTKEQNIQFLRGRVDTALSNVLIEFKQPSTLSSQRDKAKALKQTLEYLENENLEGITKTFAFLTDGIVCVVFTVDENGIIANEGFVEIQFEHYNRLIKAIVGLDQKIFDSSSLVQDFAPKVDSPIRELALILYDTIVYHGTDKTKMLLTEWKNLFKLSHEDFSQQQAIIDRKAQLGEYLNANLEDAESEYNALFALQTAYSILIKLIAFKVISEIKYDNSLVNYAQMLALDSNGLQLKMSELESGSIIRDYGIQNLLEGDFFSWYSSKQQWNDEISKDIKKIILRLNKYTTFSFFESKLKAKDFFKNLYQTVIPEPVRHSLGEYYTPYWLASHVVKKSLALHKPQQTWRALDPTCGSGTFITILINEVLQSLPKSIDDKGDILREITSRVIGIDLNPLAVLTARVNYFLNVSHLITFDTEMEIPIYAGDSAYTPELIESEGIKFVRYSLDTEISTFPIYFPEAGLKNLKKFSKTMIEIELDILSLNKDGIYNRLMNLLPVDIQERDIVKTKLHDLADKFVEFESKQWNGIWARIITNYLTTSKIGHFDIVVGNPPWVDWKNLPSQYREKIKALNITKTIFSGDNFTGGINLNIAALITNVVAHNWLSPNGVMGMLMPDTFLVQKTYEGYRNFILADGKRGYFIAVDDWTKAGNPFQNVTQNFYTYYIGKKEQDYLQGIEVERYAKKRGIDSSMENLDIANSFIVNKGKAVQASDTTTNFSILYSENSLTTEQIKLLSKEQSHYKGREGIEFYPQELLVFEFVADGVQNEKSVTVQNIQVKRSKFKLPAKKTFIEKKYLAPLVKGVNVTPFHIESELLVPFVYDKDHSKRVAIDEDTLRQKAPLTFKHFESLKHIFQAQNHYSKKLINGKNIPYYSLARVGDYTFAPYHVVFRDNTKNVASVVDKIMTPWGEEKLPVFQNHAVTISQRPDGDYISLDEAYYIAGIINSDVVTEFVKISSDGRSFPIHPRYQIPLYGKAELVSYQNKIVKLSKEAHERFNEVEYIKLVKSQIGKLYLDMLSSIKSS